jgi:CHAD domain-containing protein
VTLREFADQRTAELEQNVKRELQRTAKLADADAIHDLRVSIRRYTQALRALQGGVVPKAEVQKKRRPLKHTMELTANVRNRDIALELLAEAGVEPDSRLAAKLKRQRASACKVLVGSIAKEPKARTPRRKKQ